MKAKFIALNAAMSLILANGTIFNSVDGEKKAKFLKRVQADVELDLGELEIEELTTASFEKLTDAQLIKAASKEKNGLLKDLLNATVAERSVPVGPKAEVASEKEIAKEAAAKAKAEAAEAKAKAKAEKEAAKALIVKPTLEEITAAAALAKANVGHVVTFNPHGFATSIEGVVNGVWIDKRVPMALYRIFDAEGNRYNKTIEAPELKFGDKAPDAKAEEKAKAAAEKEEAKKAAVLAKEEAAKAKAEEKAKKAVEKEEAAKAKAEQKEKDAAAKAEAEKAKNEAKIKADASLAEMKASAENEAKA